MAEHFYYANFVVFRGRLMDHGRVVYLSLYGIHVVSGPFRHSVLCISQVELVKFVNQSSKIVSYSSSSRLNFSYDQ